MDESNETRQSRKKTSWRKNPTNVIFLIISCVRFYLKLKQHTSWNKWNQSTWSWNPQNGCDFYMAWHDYQFQKKICKSTPAPSLHPSIHLPSRSGEVIRTHHLRDEMGVPFARVWSVHSSIFFHLFFHLLILMYLRGVAQIDRPGCWSWLVEDGLQ